MTFTLVAGLLPADVALRDLGEHRLKDLTAPEHVFGLIAPDASQSGAVALFVERARAVDRRFEFTDTNAATVVDICRRLEP